MNWSARITEKSTLGSDGMLTYSFVVIGDEEDRISLSVTNTPDVIQQSIINAVTDFAKSWELAEALPQVGDTLTVVSDK